MCQNTRPCPCWLCAPVPGRIVSLGCCTVDRPHQLLSAWITNVYSSLTLVEGGIKHGRFHVFWRCMGWCSPPPPITCPNWTKSNDEPSPSSARGVVVDSLALCRTISGICFTYKLMCGPHVPCLQTLLPPRATHDPLPRTRQQVWIANGHSFQLSLALPPWSQNTVRRSFPYLYIPIWNSLPQALCESRV